MFVYRCATLRCGAELGIERPRGPAPYYCDKCLAEHAEQEAEAKARRKAGLRWSGAIPSDRPAVDRDPRRPRGPASGRKGFGVLLYVPESESKADVATLREDGFLDRRFKGQRTRDGVGPLASAGNEEGCPPARGEGGR